MDKYKWLTLCTICLFAGCTHINTNNSIIKEIVFDEKAALCTTAPSYTFIPLETGNDNLIGSINIAKIVDDRIFILDEDYSKSIQVYTLQGKFISHIGSRGNGPGEYIIPASFWIDKTSQTILVNGLTNQLIVYDLNTYEYLYSKKAPTFSTFISMPGGHYAWWTWLGYKDGEQTYDVMITDSLFQNKRYCYPRDYEVEREFIFTKEGFYRLHDKTYFYKAHNPVVYEITSEGEKSVYQVVFGNHPFPPADYLNALSEGTNLMKTHYVACYQLLETDSCILARYIIGRDRYIGIYNKNENKTYRYADFHSDSSPLKETSFAGTTDDGRFILGLQAEPLKRRYIPQDDLRELAKMVSADDNPVICIVDFK
ncbi:MAG: 6-bladed beta-propeller [Dysgonamonadaceae bacterium]|nr:6-bladed beta-propeller [Dysgonamonadaceae bacterium]